MRVYDGKYLSVTSILQLKHPFDSSSFKRWCLNYGFNEALVSSTSRVLGEKVSEYLDNHSKGLLDLTGPQVDMLEGNLYSAVDNFLTYYDLVDTEQVVYCDELHYAGRYDGIIREKGTRNILLVDWKTYGAWNGKPYKRVSSKLKSAKEQLTLYAYAMDWKGGLGVVVFKNDGSWELEKVVFEKGILEWVKSHQKEILNLIAKENEKVSKKV
jgi:hypothetical protein